MAELLDITKVYMFKTEEEAQIIVDELKRLAYWYGVALRSDLKDLLNMEIEPDDYKYGWLEHGIKQTRVVATELGYFIEFPRPVLIK